MDILGSVYQDEAAVDLTSLVVAEPAPPKFPLATTRNSAATAALLNPFSSNVSESYQIMMSEAAMGMDDTQKRIWETVAQTNARGDMSGVMSVLSDPNMSIEAKEAVIGNVKKSQFLKEPSVALMTQGLSKPVAGESVEQEASRMTISDGIRQIYESMIETQGIVNAHAASLESSSNLKNIGEFVEVGVVPFATAAAAEQLATKREKREGRSPGLWERLKSGLLAGNTIDKYRKQLESIPPEKRPEFVRGLMQDISESQGLIISSDNQFSQYMMAENIVGDGGYSSAAKFIDNVAGILDIVGVGGLVRGLKKAPRTPTAPLPVPPATQVAPPAVNAAGEAPMAPVPNRVATGAGFEGEISRVGGVPTTSANSEKISQLEARKAELLGDAGNLLDKKQVSNLVSERQSISKPRSIEEIISDLRSSKKTTSKEAKKQAEQIHANEVADYEASTSRIDRMLEQNRQASTITQEVASLEKQIEALKKGDTQTPAQRNYISSLFQRVEINNTVRAENPASPAKIVQQVNPDQARALHSAVVQSEGDAVAEAVYGTSRVDAVASDVFPQAAVGDGAVVTRVTDIERDLRAKLSVPEKIIEMIHNTGATWFLKEEIAAAKAVIVNRFRNAEGLVVNDAMSSFATDGGRIKIGAVYGTTEGGFLRAEDAHRQAKLALVNEGVLDSEITILRKEGLDHVPVTLEEAAGREGNYFVRVDTYHEIDPTDIGHFSKVEVKRNFFDRLGATVSNSGGSLSRWIADAASMLDEVYTGAASVVSDRTARFDKELIKIASEYSDKWKSLPKQEQKIVNDYLREANYNGIKFDRADLLARGFSPKQVEAVRAWRNFWDVHFYLENYDVVRTLNAQGFEFFRNANAELFAKPIVKDSTIGKVYDPATDTVSVVTKTDADALYAAGGNYARLRRPTTLGGQTVEYMVVRNTPSEHLRKIRDTDQVLNYREGYFQIQYTAPKFVDELLKDSSGKVIGRKAVAVAGDTVEAESFAARMRGSTGNEYVVRGDDRALLRGSDDWWDVNSAGGRIAQRQRGKLLEDASGLNHLGDGSYILNPVESAVRAARSIAGRTIARPMLEAAKARFMSQYEKYLPSNGMGGKRFPNKVSEMGSKGEFTSSELADARTTWEYINYLENGYINGADQLVKAGLNLMANALGSIGMRKAERGVNLLNEEFGGPVSLAKNVVFTAYIGTNVLRQLIVQPHQAVRMFSYNPKGWFNGRIEKYLGEFLADKSGLSNSQTSKFTKFIDDSGLMDAVDKQNLVRGTLRDAADSHDALVRNTAKAVQVPRRIGFDTGEMANMLAHAAAVYEKYERKGFNLADKAVRDKAYSEIRAISYDMNFAGDMPYNQTSAAMILQFMQVPHKAFLQVTNRRIPVDVRMRMLLGDTILWGTPAAFIANTIGEDVLPEDKQARELVLWGAESMLLNNMFRAFSDTDTNLDLSSLAPYDMTGWGKFFEAMYSGGAEQMLMNSPAGQLFFKDGSRIENAIKAMARYFGVIEDYDQMPQDFDGMIDEIAKISSGWSNWQKAQLLLNTKKRLDAQGRPVDEKVTKIEAWAQAFGFSTADTRDLYRISQQWTKDDKKFKEDVLSVYKDVSRYYTERLGNEVSDINHLTLVTGQIMKIFENNPAALNIIQAEIGKDLSGKDQHLLRLMIKRAGVPDPGAVRDQIQQMPISDEDKKKALQVLDDTQNSLKKLRELNKENE